MKDTVKTIFYDLPIVIKPILQLEKEVICLIPEVAYEAYQAHQQNPKQNLQQLILQAYEKNPRTKKIKNLSLLVEGTAKGIIQFIELKSQKIGKDLQEIIYPSQETIYRKQAEKIRTQQDEFSLRTSNPKAWGLIQNHKKLQEIQLLGYITAEAIQWLYGEQIIKGIVKAGQRGKNFLLGKILKKANLTAHEMTRFIQISKLPKNQQYKAMAKLLAESPHLQKELGNLQKVVNRWKLEAKLRGVLIEQSLGHNLTHNFPTIDKFCRKTGVAISIKSLDIEAKTSKN